MSSNRNPSSTGDSSDSSGYRAALEFLSQVREDLLSVSAQESAAYCDEEQAGDATTIHGVQSFNTKRFAHPKELGRFQIKGLLGSGGFAEVFLAYDPRLDREVALKVPNAKALTTSDAQARFRREARLAATLSHPNIVPVFESGSCGELNFIAYEYVPGESLACWFHARNRKISDRQAAEIVQRLADAVQHAHHRGVLHRDLKPGNVLVGCGDGSNQNVAPHIQVTDFGLARLFAKEGEQLTVEGSQLGTPAYMSPEQARGEECSATSDIYSLGVVLYELLTGELPHRRSNDLATLRAIQQESIAAVHQVNPSVDRFLCAICIKCLCRSPAGRYQTAYDLQNDLASWLDGRPIQAKQPTALQKALCWTKQNRILTAAILCAVLSLAVGMLGSLLLWQQARENLSRSERQRHRAQEHIQKLESTVDGLLDEYLILIEENPDSVDMHRPLLDKVLHAHLELVSTEAEQLQSARHTLNKYLLIAKLYQGIGRFAEAKNVCGQAYQLTELLARDPGQHRLAVEFQTRIGLRQGHMERLSGSLDSAQVITDEAISKLHTLTDTPTKLGFELYRLQGLLHSRTADIPKAIQAFLRAESFGSSSLEQNLFDHSAALELVMTQIDLADCYLRSGEESKSMSTLCSVQLRLQGLVETNETDEASWFLLAYTKTEIGKLWKRQKQFPKSETELTQALAILDGIIEENPSTTRGVHRRIHIIAHLAFVLQIQHKRTDAIHLLRRGLDLATEQIRHPLGLRATSDMTRRICQLLMEEDDGLRESLGIVQSSLKKISTAGQSNPSEGLAPTEYIRLLEYSSELHHKAGEFQAAESNLLEATRHVDIHLQIHALDAVFLEAAGTNSKKFSNQLISSGQVDAAQEFLLSRATKAQNSEYQYELASQLALCAQCFPSQDSRKIPLQLEALRLLLESMDSGLENRPLARDFRWQEFRY